MGLKHFWALLRKKDGAQTVARNIDEIELEKRKLAIEERKQQVELQKIQLEQLKSMQTQKNFEDLKKNILFDDDDEDFMDDDDDDDNLKTFTSIIERVLPNNFNNQNGGLSNPLIQNNAQLVSAVVSDDDIRGFLRAQSPVKIAIAKKMKKAEVVSRAQKEMGLNTQDAEKAYNILIKEF